MQVTDAILDAAFDAYRAEQQRVGGLDWGLRREFLQAALQAAFDAAPERDDFEPPPFVAMLTEERLRGLPSDVADAVRDLLRSRAVWRALGHRQGAELEQLRAEDDARAPLWLVELPPEGIALPNGGVIRMATPEERAARMDQFRREINEAIAHRPRCRCAAEPVTAVPGDAIAHGQFHNEGGDFLPGPKRYRTGDSSEKPTIPDELLSTDAFIDFGATVLGSLTASLHGGSGALVLINPDGVAERLGVTMTQVDEWIRLGTAIRFPEPYKWVSGIPHWQVGTIDQWYELWKASNGG